MPGIRVLDFSEENLSKELSNTYTTGDNLKKKNQFEYFCEYFGSSGINAKKILIEPDYISKDYLSDYSIYYSLCFENYEKHCKRLHFFSSSFTIEEFNEYILKPDDYVDFWKSYLGFIVVKPIPYTVIGTSVLNHYDDTSTSKRIFFGTRKYKVHLFGVEKEVDSLAFQEQDSVLSACATTAIWSMLHKASEDYFIILKTPNQITYDAGYLSAHNNRLFPNKNGLSIEQMCQAIEKAGLVSEVRFNLKNEYIKQLIFAYSDIGIPIILIIQVPIKLNPDPPLIINKIEEKYIYDYHAITISGYSKQDKKVTTFDDNLHLNSNDIDKIYVHDDQMGPFSRIKLLNDNNLLTNWSKKFPEPPSSVSPKYPATFPPAIMIPVFTKIRLSYDDIQSLIVAYNQMMAFSFSKILSQNKNWDIKLRYSEMLKGDIRKSTLDENLKINYLSKSFPKYIWQASCYTGNEIIFDFIFDATDIANGLFVISIISYNKRLKDHLYNYLKSNTGLSACFKHKLSEKYFEFLISELKS